MKEPLIGLTVAVVVVAAVTIVVYAIELVFRRVRGERKRGWEIHDIFKDD